MLVTMTIMLIGIGERRRRKRRAVVDVGVRDHGRDPYQETALGRVRDLDPDPDREIVPRANLPRGTRRGRRSSGTIAIVIAESIPMTKRVNVGIIAVIDQDLAVQAAIGGGGIGMGRAAAEAKVEVRTIIIVGAKGAALCLDRVISTIAEVGLVEATAEVAAAAGLHRVIVGKNPNLQLPPSPLALAFRVGQVGVVPMVVEGG